jgi:OOP family OmpA-OmpF porin
MHGRRGRVAELVAVMGVVTLGLAGCGGSQSVAFSPSGSAAANDPAATSADAADVEDSSDAADGSNPAAGDQRQGSGALTLLKAEDGKAGSAGGGYDIPPIPDIVIPDVTVADAASKKFATKLGAVASPVKGVTVTGAVCNGKEVVNRAGVNYGNGSGVINRGGATTRNNGDGSGIYDDPKVHVINNGDGSGTYDDGVVHIIDNGDGSGTYDDAVQHVIVNGDGSGTYTDATVSIINNGDGSGTYTDATVSIINHGDGSGTYTDDVADVINNGDGTGFSRDVSNEVVKLDPLAPIAKIGKLPPMKALRPLGKECGTLIRLQDRVLFDFDKDTLRPAAGPVLDAVAAVLKGTGGTIQVNGHTDALGSDAYNLDLSERRARAVSTALTERGVTATMDAQGFGEKQPVAQNTLNGKDNPAGRQLNRRVELVVPNA